jgi:hypothetical protein
VGDLRAAEDAVAQVGTLLDAVGRLERDLEAATARLPAVRAETEEDLAEARALIGSGDAGGLRPQVARAEAGLAAADEAMAPGGGLPDPLTALRRLEEADLALEQALTVARDAQTRARRAAAALDQTLLRARSTVAAAADFVATRRGAIGPGGAHPAGRGAAPPRRRGRHRRARPRGALREAQLADQLAAQALQYASPTSRPGRPGTAGAGYGGGYGRVRRRYGGVRRRGRAAWTSAASCSAGSWRGGHAAAATAVGWAGGLGGGRGRGGAGSRAAGSGAAGAAARAAAASAARGRGRSGGGRF